MKIVLYDVVHLSKVSQVILASHIEWRGICHSYILLIVSYCLSANDSIRFLRNPLPPTELGFIYNPLT